jgi:hypothetical protein
LCKLDVKGAAMNTPRAARFLPELGPKNRTQADALDDIGGDLLQESGFESETPEQGFEERG